VVGDVDAVDGTASEATGKGPVVAFGGVKVAASRWMIGSSPRSSAGSCVDDFLLGLVAGLMAGDRARTPLFDTEGSTWFGTKLRRDGEGGDVDVDVCAALMWRRSCLGREHALPHISQHSDLGISGQARRKAQTHMLCGLVVSPRTVSGDGFPVLGAEKVIVAVLVPKIREFRPHSTVSHWHQFHPFCEVVDYC
jgi:hypothetical protein